MVVQEEDRDRIPAPKKVRCTAVIIIEFRPMHEEQDASWTPCALSCIEVS